MFLKTFYQTGFSFISHVFPTLKEHSLAICSISNNNQESCLKVKDLETNEVSFSQRIPNHCQFIPLHFPKDKLKADSEIFMMIDSIYILEISDHGSCSITPKKLFKTLPLYQFQYLIFILRIIFLL